MIYFIEESWNYPDETNHSHCPEIFHSKEAALSTAKELIESEKELFEHLSKEYHIVVFDNGYTIETIDSEYEYTVTLIPMKNEESYTDINEVRKIYGFIADNYKKFIQLDNQEPDFVQVDIRWKDEDKSERAIIALNDKHDELVTFRVNNLLELALLFFKDYGEDFVCEYVHLIHFGKWV